MCSESRAASPRCEGVDDDARRAEGLAWRRRAPVGVGGGGGGGGGGAGGWLVGWGGGIIRPATRESPFFFCRCRCGVHYKNRHSRTRGEGRWGRGCGGGGPERGQRAPAGQRRLTIHARVGHYARRLPLWLIRSACLCPLSSLLVDARWAASQTLLPQVTASVCPRPPRSPSSPF